MGLALFRHMSSFQKLLCASSIRDLKMDTTWRSSSSSSCARDGAGTPSISELGSGLTAGSKDALAVVCELVGKHLSAVTKSSDADRFGSDFRIRADEGESDLPSLSILGLDLEFWGPYPAKDDLFFQVCCERQRRCAQRCGRSQPTGTIEAFRR
mmetsp:Transcript_8727/g.18428  ORF Transcript_8727/g.18428 Transcript_8727/m.18428 type:complete len:154 (-) Transcript_8727:181-642(-)